MTAKRLTNGFILLAGLLFGSAQAISTTVGGIAVDAPGGDAADQVGSIGNGDSLNNAIEYYIPLQDATNGTYGVGGLCGGSGAGTCSDSGYGSGYAGADALLMNIFFDLTGVAEAQSASLAFEFDDLDLTPGNDPDGFFESISLSYWDSASDTIVDLSGGTITDATPPAPAGSPEQQADANLVLWDLNLAAINALNTSAATKDGFWVQLGFGSFYDIPQCDEVSSLGTTLYASYTSDTYGGAGGGGGGYHKECKDPWNTPEYLSAELTVTPVPVPASVWLFGTALIGFIGIARRTRVS